ncbi:hypothetical protein P280DRAFT_476545 [Massarina eburnea CBS 473.64]|uniref:Uncharacterized protein n=1 Tax=Massarina eburnea CBS 473.64 TaxID=1395130 RepID=A0A6A6SCR5_9PLEO|nr:hypothetical protein P280DRAFT_476545 [Massarina eburnea CBS 473.64]
MSPKPVYPYQFQGVKQVLPTPPYTRSHLPTGPFQDILTDELHLPNGILNTEPFPVLQDLANPNWEQQATLLNEYNAAAGLPSHEPEYPAPDEPRRILDSDGRIMKLWLHRADADKAFVRAMNAMMHKWHGGRAFFKSNGDLSPLTAELRKWLHNTFKATSSNYRIVIPSMLRAEIRSLLCITLVEYITMDPELRDFCLANTQFAEIFQRSLQCLDASAPGSNGQDKNPGAIFSFREARNYVKWLESMDDEDAELNDVLEVWEVWKVWCEFVECAVEIM